MTLFKVTTFKSPNVQPTVRFNNTYELFADVDNVLAFPVLSLGAIVDFEKALLFDQYSIVQLTLSTYDADSAPYDPTTFKTQDLNEVGDRDSAGETILPLRDVVYVKRQVTSGRTGKLEYRACTCVADVINPSGEWVLKPDSALRAIFLTQEADLFTRLASDSVDMMMVNRANPEVTRIVQGLSLQRMSSVSRNHRYYDVP